MTRFAVALILFAVLSWPTRAQTFIRSLPTSTNVTSATKVPVDDATYGTRAITVNNLLVGVSTNPAVLAAITNVVTDVSTTLLGNKLDTTNGTAVNLTGSLSNISLGGTTIYSGAGSNDLTANTLFNLGLRGVNGETVSVYPTAHTTKNIASLVGLNTGLVTTNATVEVRGYYEPGDGGGGTFYYAPAEATNRGTVFQSGSGSFVWKRLVDGPVTTEMFGAIPDDATDDTDAIQAAVAYAESQGSGYTVFAPGGTYLVSEPIVLTKCEFSGVRTHQSRVLTAGNTVFQTTNWNTTLYKEVFDVNPTGANDGAPWLHDIQVQSLRTNTITKIPITAVSSRRVFSISTNTTPTFQTGNQTNFYPYLGWAFFYSPAGNYMGGGTVSTAVVSGTNWDITITDGDDFYATPTGTSGLLSTACFVNFSPLTTAGGADRSDPTQVGVAGVRMRGSMSAKVENVGTYETWVGFAFSPASGTSFHWMRDLASWRTSFAGYASAVRSYQGAYDYSGEGVLFASGFSPSLDISVDNEGYSAGMFGFYNPPIASGFNQMWTDGFVVGAQSDLLSGISVDRMKLDNCFLHGLVTLDALFDLGYSTGISVGSLDIRGLVSSTDVIDAPNGRAIWMRGKTYPAEIWAGTLTIPTAPYSRFDYAIDITNSVANSLTIGRMMTGSGFTNWIPSTSRLPALLSSAYGSTNSAVGWSYNNTVARNLGAAISLANSGTNRLTVNSSGVTGYSADGSTATFAAGNNTFTAYGSTNIYQRTTGTGVYIGGRSSGEAADFSAALLLENATSGNVASQVKSAFGTSTFDGLTSDGTYAAPTATTDGRSVAQFGARPYDGSAYNTTARLLFLTDGAQSSTNRGSYARIELTPLNTTSRNAFIVFTNTGAITTPLGKVAIQPTTETLTYSGGTNVTITAGKGPMQRSLLTVTNNFRLLWSGLTDNDGGVVHLIPATTNVTVLVSSPGRAAGSTAATATGSTTLTITGATNGWAELAWSVVSVGGTNRVSVNLGAY